MRQPKKPRICSICEKPGHRADKCPDRGEPTAADLKKTPTLKDRAGGARVAWGDPKAAVVSAKDLPVIKGAVAAVVDALEPVPAEHRQRVIRSAQMILGYDLLIGTGAS